MFADDIDYFIHSVSDDNSDTYLIADGRYAKIEYQSDTIKIKGKDPYLYYRSFIDGAPVLSDKMFISNELNDSDKSRCFTFK